MGVVEEITFPDLWTFFPKLDKKSQVWAFGVDLE